MIEQIFRSEDIVNMGNIAFDKDSNSFEIFHEDHMQRWTLANKLVEEFLRVDFLAIYNSITIKIWI